MKKILSFIKKHRLWLTIAIALIVILIATPTFASMGHSGGGHISGGGGGGGGVRGGGPGGVLHVISLIGWPAGRGWPPR